DDDGIGMLTGGDGDVAACRDQDAAGVRQRWIGRNRDRTEDEEGEQHRCRHDEQTFHGIYLLADMCWVTESGGPGESNRRRARPRAGRDRWRGRAPATDGRTARAARGMRWQRRLTPVPIGRPEAIRWLRGTPARTPRSSRPRGRSQAGGSWPAGCPAA